VCALAEALAMPRALVPAYAGVLSALGMLVAPRGRQLSQTLCLPLQEQDDAGLRARLDALTAQGRTELLAEGVDERHLNAAYSLDLRYQGQRFTLNVAYSEVAQAVADFHDAHRRRFGHTLQVPVELVNVRVALSADSASPVLPETASRPAGSPLQTTRLAGEPQPVAVWRREALGSGHSHSGPLLIVDDVATTYVSRGWRVSSRQCGSLLLERC
jgi:N-methylhydantoinase A